MWKSHIIKHNLAREVLGLRDKGGKGLSKEMDTGPSQHVPEELGECIWKQMLRVLDQEKQNIKLNKEECIDVASVSWDTGFNILLRTLRKNANMLGMLEMAHIKEK